MTTRLIGERIPRREDPRLVSGRGRFLDDIDLPNALEAAFVRSELAHARVRSVDTTAAAAHPGVVAVYTHVDLGDLDRALPLGIPDPSLHHPRTGFPLVREKVRLVGEPIAMVVACDRATAEDAAALVEVDYEPLPPVVTLDDAFAGRSLVHDDVPENAAADMRTEYGDIERALADAPHVISRSLHAERAAAMPLETRGVIADFDARLGHLTVYDSTQAPNTVRAGLAGFFHLPEHRVDVIAPDIGGGFGVKIAYWYPEELLVPFASIRLGRPVKWVEDRREHFVGSNHERGQQHDIRVAFDDEGHILGIDDRWLFDAGAYVPYGVILPLITSNFMPGPYKVRAYRSAGRVLYTNTVPSTPYRGAGQPEACFLMERLLDAVAQELDLDRTEVRRRNLIRHEEFPYSTGTIDEDASAMVYDSGDPPRLLEEALRLVRFDNLERERTEVESRGRKLGFGVALYMEITGGELYEGARVHIEPSGKVFVTIGVSSQGQGHETVMAQIAAETLGVPIDDVQVVTGDTRHFKWGVGTFASRILVVAGNAVAGATELVRKKALALAAEVLEASVDDLTIEDGRVFVRGSPERGITMHDLAHLANPVRVAYDEAALEASQFATRRVPTLEILGEPGLEATYFHKPESPTWASGCHAAVVEIDPETFELEFRRYVAVHDCGRVINPMIVEGQICGGIAQGIGGAYYERIHYDESGQLVNANFMDYLIPYVSEIPELTIGHVETLSTTNPLGAKGCGEAGVIPVSAVVASAIEDALGIQISESQLSPTRLFELTREPAVATTEGAA